MKYHIASLEDDDRSVSPLIMILVVIIIVRLVPLPD